MSTLKKIVGITATVGLIDSIYLVFVKYAHNEALCIPGVGDCWSVNNSPYSEIFGIPIAFIGALVYLVILLLVLNENKFDILRKNGPYILFGITITGFIYSIYLTYLEIAVIKAICPFCVISALAMTVLLVTSVIRLLSNPGVD